jgi:hypothetical protein
MSDSEKITIEYSGEPLRENIPELLVYGLEGVGAGRTTVRFGEGDGFSNAVTLRFTFNVGMGRGETPGGALLTLHIPLVALWSMLPELFGALAGVLHLAERGETYEWPEISLLEGVPVIPDELVEGLLRRINEKVVKNN